MRDYEWCNRHFRDRKPRSRDYFKNGYDTIIYDRENDRFELKYNGIYMNRDGSISVTDVDAQLKKPYNQGWMNRVWEYTGVWLGYPKNRKLHAYVTVGNRYITGDFTVTPDKKVICKAPLKEWIVDETIYNKKRKAEKLLKLASKFTEKEPRYDFWAHKEKAESSWWKDEIPLSQRVEWFVNMPYWVFGFPGRGKFDNIRRGHWKLRPVPKAKQLPA